MGREDEGGFRPLGVGDAQGSFFVVSGGPVKSVGGNVGVISVSVGEFVPGGLQ